jgi:outer membrane translocation and assembly module TamA
VAAAVFVDAGNVWREAWTVRLPDLRYSAGAGVRYDSPFGPLRLDLGYQLTPIDGLRMEGEPRDRRWRVHVAFGHSF